MDTLVLLYFAESSYLCRFCVESVNVFVLPRFDFCTSDIFFINKQFHTCANTFPNEFTVRSYEYWAGQHWILSWVEENQTATYFLCSRLFTYDIMKNFNCNISLCFFKSKFRSYIGKHFNNQNILCKTFTTILSIEEIISANQLNMLEKCISSVATMDSNYSCT